MFIDFHTHLLPGIDDGARDVETSLAMLSLLKKQGTDIAVATPHFYAHRQLAGEFLERRRAAFTSIASRNIEGLPTVLLGAEVYLEQGLGDIDLRPFCLGSSSCILIEMPYMGLQGWMLEEVYGFCLQQSLTPVFAHLDRYLSLYSHDALQEILDFDGALIQVNGEALLGYKSLKTVLGWIREERPVLFGSDCHDLNFRVPENDRAQSVLKSKLGKGWFETYSGFSQTVLSD